ncbi:ribonuclease H-like domain-containing protein [Tanacetum coccineum]
MVRSMWLFKHMFHADGTLSRYKAHLVANGSSQQLGVDFNETFSLVVKPATIRTVLSLVVLVMPHRPNFITVVAILLYSLIDRILGLFLSQRKYALQLLERAHMVNCKPSRTPVDTESKLGSNGVPVQDSTLYRSLAEGLQYLTFTPSDLSYAVYLKGVANVVAETAWLNNLLRELHSLLSTATLVYCDNISVVYMSANPVQHQRTKHIEIDIYFVHDMVTTGQVRVLHLPSRFQYADIFTKGLPSALFEDFRSSLSVRPPPAPTGGGVLVGNISCHI